MDLRDQLRTLLRPTGRAPRTEHLEYGAMLMRMLRALEARGTDDPLAVAPLITAVRDRADEALDAVLAIITERPDTPSQRDLAAALGIAQSTVSRRATAGREAIGHRLAAAGVTRLSEARAERDRLALARTAGERLRAGRHRAAS